MNGRQYRSDTHDDTAKQRFHRFRNEKKATDASTVTATDELTVANVTTVTVRRNASVTVEKRDARDVDVGDRRAANLWR